jgi:hypothetical protein
MKILPEHFPNITVLKGIALGVAGCFEVFAKNVVVIYFGKGEKKRGREA